MYRFIPHVLLACLFVACTVEESADPEVTPTPDAGETPTPDAGGEPPAQAACPTETTGPTFHEGDLEGDEIWTAEASPHVVRGDVNVRDGKKLVIEPCAVVQMVADANLHVAFPLTPNQGELVAEGDEERPIRFESRDGARWGRIFVNAPGTARLAYVTLEDGGGSDAAAGESLAASGDGELPSKPVLFVDHVTIKRSFGAGVKVNMGGKFTEGSRDLVVTESGNPTQPYPVVIGESALGSLPTGSYTGNHTDTILLAPEVVAGAGGVQEDSTIFNRGVPYQIGLDAGYDDLQIGSGSDDKEPPTVVIEAGVQLLFLPNTGLHVVTSTTGSAVLQANGTAEAPIVFTSAQPEPAPGDWRGIRYHGTPSNRNKLDYVHLEYTGADCSCSMVTCSAGVEQYEAALLFDSQPPSAFLTNSVIRHASSHGVVQGYDGVSLDWQATNTYEDVAGCPQTLPRNPDTTCPDPMPACR